MIILVMGLPGSGKSFFAKRLAERLDMAYLNSDAVRKETNMMGKYEPGQRFSVYENMAEKAKAILQKNKSLVVDATFQYSESRQLFSRLAVDLGIKLVCFYIWADEKLIEDRLSQNREDSEADFEVYQKIKSDYAEIDERCNRIKSTNKNIEQMLTIAIAKQV
jgi:predicted kinase